MGDPKFMSMLFAVLVSSDAIKRSGISYGKKILLSSFLVLCLSFFYYNNYPDKKTNLFFPIGIFLIFLFLISYEKKGREQAKEFFTNLIRKIRNIAVKNK